MGIVNPLSLKCIAPYDGSVDMYRGTAYHGGTYCDFMAMWYQMIRVNNLQRAANGPGGHYMPLDLAGETAKHQTYDDWRRERCAWERLDEIKVPVLSIGHWGKMGLHLRGNILGYEKVKSPKKLVVTGAKDVFEAHDQFDHISYHEQELLPFYDHYLNGQKNGYEKRPNVRCMSAGGMNGAKTRSGHRKRRSTDRSILTSAHRRASIQSMTARCRPTRQRPMVDRPATTIPTRAGN
jgi:predicted acyl esterase